MTLLLSSLVLFYAVAIFMPKRISWLDISSVVTLSLILEAFSDLTLNLKLNLFGYIEPGDQWTGFLPIFLYPPINSIYVNYYPFQRRKRSKAMYILGWTVFCLVYELAALNAGFFYYTTWKLWYSALCYPVLLLIVLWHVKFIRFLQRLPVKASQADE